MTESGCSWSQEQGGSWTCSVPGWAACGWAGSLGPLALSGPAVHPGPVGHLGRGEEEGPNNAADPGLRSRHEQRWREKFLVSLRCSAQSSPLGPAPFCWQTPCRVSPRASARPPLCTLNSIGLFLSSRCGYSRERGPIEERTPQSTRPLEAGH